MTYISLFSGIGGLDMAVESVIGESPEVYVESNKFARQVLQKKLGGVILEDAREIDYKEFRGVEGIVGGWPCQPHSLAGKRLGAEDERDMWKYFIRAIRDIKPRWILGENVKGVLSSQKGEYFGRILGDLAEAGYSATWRTIMASDVGAPHRRERLFIYATANSYVGRREQYSEEERDLQIISENNIQPIAYSESERGGLESSAGTRTQQAGIQRARETQDVGDAAHHGLLPVAPDTEDTFGRFGIGEVTAGKRLGWGRSTSESAFDWHQYEPAIRRWESIVGSHPYPVDEKNRLTPNFIEWFMGFPKDWTEGLSRNQALRGLGNAVVPLQGAIAFFDLIKRSRTLNL